MTIDRDTITALTIIIPTIIATGVAILMIFDMKKFHRNIASTPTVSTEITYIAPHGSTLLSISGDLAEPDETFDVFFELTSGYDINLYDSAGNKYEYWFPCIISKEHKHAYRIVTASPGKDLLTLTIIGRNQIIRRYLEIDFSED